MANEARKGAGERLVISIDLKAGSNGERPEGLTAYLFDAGGKLIEQRPIGKGGKLEFKATAPAVDQDYRLIVGPDTGDEKPTLSGLRRAQAFESRITSLGSQWKGTRDFVIDGLIWDEWLRPRCCVRGKVVKRVGTGSHAVELPVCSSTVEVYEVDPLEILLPRIPDLELDKFRRYIVDRPIPRPGDPPPFERGPIGPPPLPPQTGLMAKFRGGGLDLSALSGDRQRMFDTLPDSFRAAVSSGDMRTLRSELLLNPHIAWPIFCWFWPRFVTKTKVGEGAVDSQGRFKVCFRRSFWNPDQPDLWFKVVQDKGTPEEAVIHALYPVGCHTWWNFACGSEVTLYAGPHARTCYDDPVYGMDGEWVVLEAIGTVSPDAVYGLSQTLAGSTTSGVSGNIGTIENGGPVDSPFANLIRIRLQFSAGLRALGAMYRVSASVDGGATWTLLDREVRRTYVRTVGGHPVYDRLKLGPTTAAPINFFSSQPLAAPLGGAWTIPAGSERDDLTSAYLPTIGAGPTELTNGKVLLRVEVFDNTGAAMPMGGPVPYDFYLYVSPSVDPVDAGTLPATVSVGGNAMEFTLHVDNRPCYAEIQQPRIGSDLASLNCGGLTYHDASADLEVPFVASHPEMRCWHEFGMVRGANNAFPFVESADATPGYFRATASISDMLGGCSGAAFSANLSVFALATDGWDRQSQFDRYWVYAFMLTPGPLPHP
ncbi:MAG: hypothetical protein JST30_09030 [Armatimonadetes bacterium]|nr:hypothetical protein [Armatimonadota bacterium]